MQLFSLLIVSSRPSMADEHLRTSDDKMYTNHTTTEEEAVKSVLYRRRYSFLV